VSLQSSAHPPHTVSSLHVINAAEAAVFQVLRPSLPTLEMLTAFAVLYCPAIDEKISFLLKGK